MSTFDRIWVNQATNRIATSITANTSYKEYGEVAQVVKAHLTYELARNDSKRLYDSGLASATVFSVLDITNKEEQARDQAVIDRAIGIIWERAVTTIRECAARIEKMEPKRSPLIQRKVDLYVSTEDLQLENARRSALIEVNFGIQRALNRTGFDVVMRSIRKEEAWEFKTGSTYGYPKIETHAAIYAERKEAVKTGLVKRPIGLHLAISW